MDSYSDGTYKIYSLSDPETNDLRYIGFTGKTLHRRLNAHINDSKRGLKSYRNNWIRSLLSRGVLPKIDLVETVDENKWQERERYWIKYHRDNGSQLVNQTDGGEGVLGLVPWNKGKHGVQKSWNLGVPMTHEVKEVLRLSHLGKKLSDEHKTKIALAGIGRRHSEETKIKMSKSSLGHHRNLGLKKSEEFCRKLGERKVGNKNRVGSRNSEKHRLALIRSRLSVDEEKFRIILKKTSIGVKQCDLAKEFKINRSTIGRIQKNPDFYRNLFSKFKEYELC